MRDSAFCILHTSQGPVVEQEQDEGESDQDRLAHEAADEEEQRKCIEDKRVMRET